MGQRLSMWWVFKQRVVQLVSWARRPFDQREMTAVERLVDDRVRYHMGSAADAFIAGDMEAAARHRRAAVNWMEVSQ